jgi:hypothetical protein
MEYKLKDIVPCNESSIIKVIGDNYYLVASGGYCEETTWKELIDKARMDFRNKHGTCLIIIENPMSGTVYSYGNYNLTTIYEHGETKGYA